MSKILDLLLEMDNNGDISEIGADCCCNSCRSYLLYGGKHSDNCNMVKLLGIIEKHRLDKTAKETQVNKYKKEKADRMNARIIGYVEACYYSQGEELKDYIDDFIGQKVHVSHCYGKTYDIEEFEDRSIDHEFQSYRITTDNFEFLGEIV